MTFGTVAIAVLTAFFLLMIVTRLILAAKARAMRGKPVPNLPGEIGKRIRASGRGLVYFFSPSCGACRAWTPRLRELSKNRRDVYVVDATEDGPLAHAFGIMATPSTIEIANGKVVGFYIGAIPAPVLAKFAEAGGA